MMRAGGAKPGSAVALAALVVGLMALAGCSNPPPPARENSRESNRSAPAPLPDAYKHPPK